MSAPAQPFAQQASADLSSEQASAGNNAASMQTSSVPTQHAQVLPPLHHRMVTKMMMTW